MERPYPDLVRSAAGTGMRQAAPEVGGLLPCGCHGVCDCPPYALAAAAFFAGVAAVLTSPLLFAVPLRPPGAAEVSTAVLFGLGLFLTLGLVQFAFAVVAIASALLADRDLAAARI